MKKLLARALALLLALAVAAPTTAQLLPPLPGASLIVTLTSPSQGANVSGTIPVSASVSIVGALTVSRVEFFRNGNSIGSDSGAPYSVSWNTTTVSNGSHTLSAVAVDVLGVRWTSNSVTVNVSNGPPPDTAAPNVSITSPGNGATVSGTINVTASASDNVGVTGVRFLLDGAVRADDTSSPYSISWNTATASNGSHTLTAVARDAAGNTRTSAPVTVTVANDTTRPTVTINQASGQADPTSASPINFTVVFSESVNGFTADDVTISGTAGGTKTVTLTCGSNTYCVEVRGMTTGGTVIATVAAGVATDAAGNTNTASTSTDNTVTFNSTLPALTIASFSPTSGPVGTVVTITGNNFIGATGVAFNGVPATTASLDSNTQITATVPSGATTGPISVTTPVGTATSGTSFTVDSATPGVTRSEESAASVAGTGWVLRGSEIAAFSGGTAGSSDVGGDTASFTFSGTAVSWIGLKCNICGIATVSIDGGAPISVDTAGAAAVGSPGLASEVVFTSPTLEAGTHTLVITVTGNTTSGGAHIIVDAFDVTGGTGSNATRIEQDNAAVSYAGTWVRDEANPAASGGTFSESNVAGAALTLSFTGTEVRWLGARFSGGGIARVSVDGTFVGEVNTYSASTVLGVVFTATGLSSGAHTLTIEVTGTSDPAAVDSWVIVDAFDVTP